MKNLQDHVKAIISGLDSGDLEQYGEHPEFQDEINVIAEIIEDDSKGEDVLLAYLAFCVEASASVQVWEIPNDLANKYRGNYESPGKFARQEAEDCASEEKEEFLSEYGNWIDWDGWAESPEFSDYTFIELPGHSGVYVFWD